MEGFKNNGILSTSPLGEDGRGSTYILGIESSCDDTSAAVIRDGILLSNVTASQAVHMEYGGVVPELASRAHQQNIVPVVDTALKKAGIEREQLSAIAFTRGPGLMGSLLVGVSFAKGLALSLGIPLVDVNHLQGHILAHFIPVPSCYAEILIHMILVPGTEVSRDVNTKRTRHTVTATGTAVLDTTAHDLLDLIDGSIFLLVHWNKISKGIEIILYLLHFGHTT